MFRSTFPLLASACALLLSSCATSKLTYVDEAHSATFKNARKSDSSKTVAVIGVVTSGGVSISGQERRAIAGDLSNRLSKNRRKTAVIDATKFQQRVGAPNLSIGSSISLSGILSSSERAKAVSQGIDYGLVAIVRKNATSRDVGESCSTDEHHTYDKEGNIISTCVTTTYTTTSTSYRSSSGEYVLYDFSTGKQVWVCASSHSEGNSNSRSSEIHYPRPPSHPSPPCISDVVENMNASSLRKFPK